MSTEDEAGNFVGHSQRECGEHRTVGSRAWCHDCGEWCYPAIPCRGCELPALRAEVERLRTESLEAQETIQGLRDAAQQSYESIVVRQEEIARLRGELAGLRAEAKGDPSPGDRVRVTVGDLDSVAAGFEGRLVRIDESDLDEGLPYLVARDDGLSYWVRGIEASRPAESEPRSGEVACPVDECDWVFGGDDAHIQVVNHVAEHHYRPGAVRQAAPQVIPSQSQKDAMAQLEHTYQDLLASIWLYVKWRYVTKQLTTEQKELWADAVQAISEQEHPGGGADADRWWREPGRPAVPAHSEKAEGDR